MDNILFLYFQWHFLDRPKNILQGWGSCLKFNLNYWSLPVLLKTFFSPWRRYQYSYGKGFSLARYAEVFSFNIISRTIGAIMRSFLIVAGLITEIIVFLIGLTVFFIWLILPFLLILAFFYGFKALF
jgi:hypothetical protein